MEVTKEQLIKALKECGFKTSDAKIDAKMILEVLDKIPERKEEEKNIYIDKIEMSEDIQKAIQENPDIKISNEDKFWVISLDEGTLLHFKVQFIQGGMEFKDFEEIDDNWVGRNMYTWKELDKNLQPINGIEKPHKHNWQFTGRKIMGTGEFELLKGNTINSEIKKPYLEFVCPCGASKRVLEKEVEI